MYSLLFTLLSLEWSEESASTCIAVNPAQRVSVSIQDLDNLRNLQRKKDNLVSLLCQSCSQRSLGMRLVLFCEALLPEKPGKKAGRMGICLLED